MNKEVTIPLCVDLDGTLVKLDTLHQALFLLLRRDFFSLFRIPGWLLKGKAHLKDQVMQRVALDAEALPYNRSFLDWLREQHTAGRKLILATASNYRTAQSVADHLGIFDEVLASNAETNLRDNSKLEAIQARLDRFAYAGNDRHDIPIWNDAEEIILVNPSRAARTACEEDASYVFEERKPRLLMLIKAMRCEQWLKNVLIFTPMLLAHRLGETTCIIQTLLAFFSFSLAASSIYVLNDLFDLSADQHHPRKCRRPFASGDLPISSGALLMPLLAGASLALCLLLPTPFLWVLLTYYAITTLYSWRLKQLTITDVLTLAILYSMRIFAGAVASCTPASTWFIEFAIFLFLSLALVKRLSELREIEDAPEQQAHRERGYRASDLPLLLGFGAASGYISVLVFTMYLGSENVARLYDRPDILWIFCPLLLYWITRIWHLAWRGEMHDDPLAFAARDFHTYLVGALGVAAILFAI
ncbi:MAG: UbiA family prenyltransferase [Pontiellaceae bacterium]|nr:UbiA family prenyltransferase [Pontiellaceae bacterium]MBN2784675.1 UbiA family prenyltransferase [Pontiellaceae bacterium]